MLDIRMKKNKSNKTKKNEKQQLTNRRTDVLYLPSPVELDTSQHYNLKVKRNPTQTSCTQ